MRKALWLLGFGLALLLAACGGQGGAGSGGGGTGGGGNGGNGGSLACLSPAGSPGETWKIYTGEFSTVTYAKGCYIALQGDVALFSSDGLLWDVRLVAQGKELEEIAEGKGVLVAVGDRLYVSTDGRTWEERSLSPQPTWLGGVAFADDKGLFVVVGSGGAIFTSADGQTWFNRTSGTTQSLTAVTYGAGTFLAVGLSGTILRSTDGIQWTGQQLSGADDIYSIAFGEGQFVINGRGGMFVSSDQGQSWQRVNAPTDPFSPVAFGQGRFVTASSNSGKVVVYDGATVQEISLPTPNPITFVAFVRDHFLARTGWGELFISSDGVNWGSLFNPGNEPVAVYHLDGRFFLLFWVPGGTTYAFSPDGVHWTPSTQTIPGKIYALAYGNNIYVAVGDNGALFYSDNGDNWSPAQVQGATSDWDLRAVVYTGTRFVAVGLGGLVLVSDDGRSWQVKKAYSGTENDFYALAYGGDKLVGASEDGSFWVSTDQGESWTSVYSEVSVTLNDIVWANGRFVAVGDYATILTSENGETWVEENPNLTGFLAYADLHAVAYDPERDILLVTGDFYGQVSLGDWVTIPVILRKQGSGDWELVSSSLSSTELFDFTSLAFGNGRFVAAGSYSLGVTP